MRRSSAWWSVALGGALLTCRVALAQPVIDIPHPEPQPDGHFGSNIAELGGDILVSAARGSSSFEGEVYLFDGATGALLRTFVSPDPMTSSFGVSLASVAGNALIGAYGNGGAAFLFDPNTGALIRTFSTSVDPDAGFGVSVAALGSNVLVGANGGDTIPGAVYLFDAATGTLLRTFQAPSPANLDQFGVRIAALGSNVLVGAPGNGSGPGAAYLFDGATGALLQSFVDPSPPGGDPVFGADVAAAGGNALVGDPLDDTLGPNAGAVHLFDASNGMLIRTFSPPILGTGFGSPLAVSGGHLVVGTSTVLAFVFDIATGAHTRTLRDPTPGTALSGKVGFADGHPVLTNPQDEFPTVRSGAVYVFCGGGTGCGPCETCGPAGTCVVAPHPSCDSVLTGKTRLRVVNRPTSDGGDVVSWSALGDFGTPLGPEQEIFGLPTDATLQHDYTLCLYDESGPTPSLLFRATAPAGGTCGSGPCWEERENCGARSCGVKYKDGEFSPEGVQKLVATQRTLLKFLGRGESLSNRPGGLPVLPLPLPLRAQLQVREGGICWEAEYTAATANSSQVFRARTD